MSTEPTHRVHRLLKEYARRHQQQEGPTASLDPGARARLQAEVARAFGPDGPVQAPRPYALGVPNLWPRLLWGGACALAVVGIATVVLRTEGDRQRQVAQADKLQFFPSGAGRLSVPAGGPAVAENVRSFQLGSTPQAAPTPGPSSARSLPGRPRAVRPIQVPAPELTKPRLALAIPRSESEMEEMASNAPRFAVGLTPPRETAAAAEDAKPVRDLADAAVQAPAPASVALNTALPRSQNNLLFQQDRSKYRQNRNSPPLPEVLTRFEVQPDGANVRIVDADGSVYAGAAAPSINEGQPFTFRAAGTNRTLNQLVVFTGEFEPSANLASTDQNAAQQAQNVAKAAAPTTATRAKAGPQATRSLQPQRLAAPAASNLTQQGRIQGQATIGGKEQLNIEAQQVAP